MNDKLDSKSVNKKLDNGKLDNGKMSYLSKICFDCLKGYFALCVLFHHLYQFTGIFVNTKIEMIFKYLGYYSVAMFIFISGFGLYESLSLKGDEYLKKFPFKRILSFYFIYCILAAIYFVYDLCLGIVHSFKELLYTLTYGGTVISFGWYLQLNLLMYIVFYLIFKFVKISKLRSLFIALLAIGFYVFNYLSGTPEYLYTPVIFFVFGILFARNKEFIDKALSKFHVLFFIVSFLIFAAGLISIRRYLYLIPNVAVPMVYTVSGLFFIIFIITIARFSMNHAKGIIVNPVSKFYGIISLEIYAFQGIVLRTLAMFNINKYIFILLAIICCTLIAIPFNRLFNLLQKKIFRK